MMNYIKIILICLKRCLLLNGQLFSQTNTFIRDYSKSPGFTAIQTKDGEYLIESHYFYLLTNKILSKMTTNF